MNRKVLQNKAYLMAHSFNRTKLFHSKKGWLMSSALVLAMLGVGASVNQARVHAAQNAQPTTHNQVTPVKTNAKPTLSGAGSASAKIAQPSSVASTSAKPATQPSSVSNTANNLHQKLVNNIQPTSSSYANYLKKYPQLASLYNSMEDKVQDEQNQNQHQSGQKVNQPKKSVGDTDNNYFSGSYTPGNKDGITYKMYDNGGIEFTGGTATGQFPNSTATGQFPNLSDINSDAQAVKIDNGIHTSNLFHVFGSGGKNNLSDTLKAVDFGSDFNTKNISDMEFLFDRDSHLHSIVFSKNFNTRLAKQSTINMNGYINNGEADMFRGDNDLQSITIKSPDTVFNSDANLPNTWYKKDSDDKYTSAQPTNLMDGKSNVGTFVTTPDPRPSSDTAILHYQNGNQSEGSDVTLPKQTFGKTVSIGSLGNSSNIPKGFNLVNPNQKITYNHNTYTVQVTPAYETDNVIFEYQVKPDEYAVVGEPTQYYGQDNSSIKLQDSDMPKGYHTTDLANSTSDTFNIGSFMGAHDNATDKTHVILLKAPSSSTNIPLVPNTVNIKGRVILHYSYGNKSRNIPLDYMIQDSDDKSVNLLNSLDYANPNQNGGAQPTDFTNQIIQGFDTHNFTFTGANGNWQSYKPSNTNFNHGSTSLVNPGDITLNYSATSDNSLNHKTDNIEYISNGHTINQQVSSGSDGTNVPMTVPNGYHLANSNTVTYDGTTHNVQVVGNTIPQTGTKNLKPSDTQPQQNESITVNVNEYNHPSDINKSNVKPASSYSDSISLVGHKIGDTITINPSEYTPAGYNATDSDEPITATIIPEPNNTYGLKYNNNAKVNNNTIPYNYTYNYGNNTANPLKFEYETPNHSVVSSDTFNVPATTPETPAAPAGYNIVKETGPNQYQIITNPKSIAAKSSALTVPITVKPKQANQLTGQGKVNVHIVEKNSKGDMVNSYNAVFDEGSKSVGSDFYIEPNSDTQVTINAKNDKTGQITQQPIPLIPTGYAPDPTDNPISVKITNDGAITDNGTDTFIYDATSHPAQITFTNADNPSNNILDNSGKPAVSAVNGDPGSKITNADLPHGYHLPSDVSYSFNKQGQLVDNNGNTVHSQDVNGKSVYNIAIKGDPIQGKADIILQYQITDPTGKKVVKTITNTADDAQVILNGEVGGSQTINPWKYWKKDFSLPKRVANQSDTIHFTPSDVNANDENGQQLNKKLIYTFTAQQAGNVVINYVDVDNDNTITSSDLGNFNGLVGQQVEVGQKGSDKDNDIPNNNGVYYVLNVPAGYHLQHHANPLTLTAYVPTSQMVSMGNPFAKELHSFRMLYHSPVSEVLTVGLTKPTTKSGSASSASTKASGSASASGTSASSNSVAPSSTNSSTNSSATNNSGSTSASSATSGNNSATQSGNSSAKSGTNNSANSASGNSANPSSSANSASSANTDNIMPFIPAFQNSSSASSSAQSANVTPASASISSVAPSFVISPNSSAIQSSATNNSATPSSSDTTVEPEPSQASQSDQSDTAKASSDVPVLSNHKNDNTNASDTGNALVPTAHDNANTNDAGISGNAISPAVSGNGASDNAIVPSDNVSVSSDDVASSNNVANPNASAEKLPQTNEASNYTGIMTVVALMLGIGLAGADVERKHE